MCPVCLGVLGDGDIAVLYGHLSQVYESLTLTCKDCMTNLNIQNAKLHRLHCKRMKKAKIYQPRPRQPIRDVYGKHVKHRRLKPVYDFLNDFCATNQEEKTEMLFFLLKDDPKDKNDQRYKDIERVWGSTGAVN